MSLLLFLRPCHAAEQSGGIAFRALRELLNVISIAASVRRSTRFVRLWAIRRNVLSSWKHCRDAAIVSSARSPRRCRLLPNPIAAARCFTQRGYRSRQASSPVRCAPLGVVLAYRWARSQPRPVPATLIGFPFTTLPARPSPRWFANRFCLEGRSCIRSERLRSMRQGHRQ